MSCMHIDIVNNSLLHLHPPSLIPTGSEAKGMLPASLGDQPCDEWQRLGAKAEAILALGLTQSLLPA